MLGHGELGGRYAFYDGGDPGTTSYAPLGPDGSSGYSVISLGKMACRYVSFELPESYLELAQALLVGYFKKLERG
jgi:hypothetical protein